MFPRLNEMVVIHTPLELELLLMRRQKHHYQHNDIAAFFPFVCMTNNESLLENVSVNGLQPYDNLFSIVILTNLERYKNEINKINRKLYFVFIEPP